MKRAPEGNKGTFGKIFLVAGSRDIFRSCLFKRLCRHEDRSRDDQDLPLQKRTGICLPAFLKLMLQVYDEDTDIGTMMEEGMKWGGCIWDRSRDRNRTSCRKNAGDPAYQRNKTTGDRCRRHQSSERPGKTSEGLSRRDHTHSASGRVFQAYRDLSF